MAKFTDEYPNIFAYLTNEWYNQLKDQVVIHAIHNLLNKKYEPALQGVTPFYISSITSNLLKDQGICISPTWDLTNGHIMVQKLVDSLSRSNPLFLSLIHTEVEKLWKEYYEGLYPNMP